MAYEKKSEGRGKRTSEQKSYDLFLNVSNMHFFRLNKEIEDVSKILRISSNCFAGRAMSAFSKARVDGHQYRVSARVIRRLRQLDGVYLWLLRWFSRWKYRDGNKKGRQQRFWLRLIKPGRRSPAAIRGRFIRQRPWTSWICCWRLRVGEFSGVRVVLWGSIGFSFFYFVRVRLGTLTSQGFGWPCRDWY